MSLKAKLEAVIYAAEEPVTLAQLAALFAAEALEWKAEEEAEPAESAADTLPLEEPGSTQPDAASEPPAAHSENGAEPAEAARDAEGPLEIPIEIPVLDNADGDSPETAPEVEPGSSAEAAAPGEDPEAEAKRLARQRDRDVKVILRQVLDELIAEYASDKRGVEIREIAGGYRMATKPECHDAVRSFVKSLKPALKLSLPALETLAVVAYKQPITAPEVNEIRGVESSGVFGSLLARKLIATAGRKQVIGRPILYKTTKEFLLRFGLKDLSELPSMEEFEKMAAIELEETSAAASEPLNEEPAAPEETAEAIEADLQAELNEPSAEEAAPSVEAAMETETPEQASTTSAHE
jgi:segregation and condensation protein B